MTIINSNMAGNVWKVLVKKGDMITEGQDVVILESMKMEIPIPTEVTGIVKEVKVSEGDFVNDGDELVVIEKNS
ncbi:acetyl-CoA carboxylase biotin carboxyl carrier protein subunit [Bacillus sp. Marseille-P3661]|uniref:acetyl-CoA carboxylase biotin carboxyl carrier protein subunit n=1 Tax=Bacillus sp. Marseille-P3661 TaxID=1936234 RepID=UPI000C859D93|nr:acetyl-CoA carboxylase biotin carboxyl carrier protein subunit [Bacillus sp. Marseille-P3661]